MNININEPLLIKVRCNDSLNLLKSNLKEKKGILQFIPETLNNISDKVNIAFNNKTLKTAYIIDIVHNMIMKYYFKKDNKYTLSSTILKEKYGKNYNYYIDYLLHQKIIYLLKEHNAGLNSRVYSLYENILNDKILRYNNTNKLLLEKYRKKILNYNYDNSNYNTIPKHIKEKLTNDLFKFKIDFEKSINYLDENRRDYSLASYNRNKYSVEALNTNHIFFHFDNFGRMHTNFTILKAHIRKNFLICDDKQTFEIDIKNSQPLFLYKLIKNTKLNRVNPKELLLFKKITTEGVFYQYIANKNKDLPINKIKKLVYKMLFGKNYFKHKDEFFYKEFPTIYDFIVSYKKKNNSYKSMSYILQSLESNFIYNTLISEIYELNKEIPIISIHDSIIIPSEYKDIVMEIYNRNMKKYIKNI